MIYSHDISKDTFREQCGICGKQIELVKNCELFFINLLLNCTMLTQECWKWDHFPVNHIEFILRWIIKENLWIFSGIGIKMSQS